MSDHTDKISYIRENGVYVSSPKGRSMLPFIREGRDSVVVVPVKTPLRKYDIILYVDRDGSHVMHRIIGVRDGEFTVRGDNCYFKESVARENVIGVAEKILKNGKEKEQP